MKIGKRFEMGKTRYYMPFKVTLADAFSYEYTSCKCYIITFFVWYFAILSKDCQKD